MGLGRRRRVEGVNWEYDPKTIQVEVLVLRRCTLSSAESEVLYSIQTTDLGKGLWSSTTSPSPLDNSEFLTISSYAILSAGEAVYGGRVD
jgi:hypothetical protein